MTRKWTTEPVEPVDHKDELAFVNGSLAWYGPQPIYPPDTVADGASVRKLRSELRLGLRVAAEALGVTAAELTKVERGAVRVSNLDALLEELRAAGEMAR